MEWLRQSTAVTVKMGPFLDSTDGDTEETLLTISQADIRLSKNGGAYAQTNNAAGATHDEGGEYGVPLDTTDTGTLGRLKVRIHESGALAVWEEFLIVPANVYDALVLGTDVLTVDVTQWLGTAAATPTVAGVPEVDLTHIMGTILTEGGAGRLAAAFIKLFDTAAPLLVADAAMRGTNSAALATLFTGMTSVAEWLGAMAGKQASDATAQTEMRATGAGSGGYLSTTDSDEARRDRGDDAWITGVGTGSGTIEHTHTVRDGSGNPVAQCIVEVSTDAGKSNVIAQGITDNNGDIILSLDEATYYFWRRKAGVIFEDPVTVEVTP